MVEFRNGVVVRNLLEAKTELRPRFDWRIKLDLEPHTDVVDELMVVDTRNVK